jgi:hypothetical protein
MKWTYMIDPLDQAKYRIPEDDVADFQKWARQGFQKRFAGGFKKRWDWAQDSDEMLNARQQKHENDFALQEMEGSHASAYWSQDFKSNNAGKSEKQNHAETPVSVVKNTVLILDEDKQEIAKGTLVAKNKVAYLKHYESGGRRPMYVQRHGKTFTILAIQEEVTTAKDYFVFAGFAGEFPQYSKNELKLPTARCRGQLIGLGGLEAIKVDIGVDKAIPYKDIELRYHGTSEPKNCGRAIIDTEDNKIIGLNAGVYGTSGVCFGVPVTEATLLAWNSFLF